MHKKLRLLLIGFTIAVVAFITYQRFLGGGFNLNLFPAAKVETDKPAPSPHIGTPPIAKFSFEQREEDGRLTYRLDADSAEPQGQGKYLLHNTQLQYFTKDGQLLLVTSDSGTVYVDQISDTLSGSAPQNPDAPHTNSVFGQGQIFPRSGTLSGHVMLTLGPKVSFKKQDNSLQPGQTQIHLDKDLAFNYQDRTLNSPGGIHVRGDRISFDGSELAISFNSEQKRIEYLKIAHGDHLILHNLPNSAAPPPPAATPAKEPATASTGPATQDGAVATTAPAVPAPTIIAAATTAPGATAYHMTFSDDVTAVYGSRTVSADLFSLMFESGTGSALESQKPQPAPAPTDAPATPAAQPAIAPTTAPATVTAAAPTDLVVHWTGPLEMRPIDAEAAGLAGPKDAIFQASSVHRAVLVTDLTDPKKPESKGGSVRTIAGDKLTYHALTQVVRMESSPERIVRIADPTVGTATAAGVMFDPARQQIVMTGPLQLNYMKDGGTAKGQKAEPITASCLQQLVLTLGGGQGGGKRGPTQIKQAVLTGSADLRDQGLEVGADTLDAVFWTPPTGKGRGGLEKAIATGNAHLINRTAENPATPDVVNSDQMTLLTKEISGNRVLDSFQADGSVIAETHAARGGSATQPARMTTQKIRTKQLVAKLEPKAKAARTATTQVATTQTAATQTAAARPDPNQNPGELGSANAGVALSTLEAHGSGTEVEIDEPGQQPVTATATDLLANRTTGEATLWGDRTAPAGEDNYATITQAGNHIGGMELKLDRDQRSITVPGAGTFSLLASMGGPNDAPRPVVVRWKDHMDFDGLKMLASFKGNIEATLGGNPNEKDLMTADALYVKLAKGGDAQTTNVSGMNGGMNGPGGGGKLLWVMADGQVIVRSEASTEDGTALTTLLLKSGKLAYDRPMNLLTVPTAGELLFGDYRPETGGAAGHKSARGETAFQWRQSMRYEGDAAVVKLLKDVKMVHKPREPLKTPVAVNAVTRGVAGNNPNEGLVILQCQALSANLESVKPGAATQPSPSSGPPGMGLAAGTRVSHVNADGGPSQASLLLNDTQLNAATLDYDAKRNQAVAAGRNGVPASAFKVGGSAVGTADQILWDLTQGDGGFRFVRPTVQGGS